MNKVLLGRRDEFHMPRRSIDSMFRLRKQVFRDRLGWDVGSKAGREVDRYDTEERPIYMISVDRRSVAHGTWRLLPTTGDYMLPDVFPELLRGEVAPRDPRIWELSRFATAPMHGEDRRQATLSSVTYSMIETAVNFAHGSGIENFVVVTSVALERMLRQLGVPIRRFGDGKATRVGKVLSVACWIPINAQLVAVANGDQLEQGVAA